MSLKDNLLLLVLTALLSSAGAYPAAQPSPFDQLIGKFRKGQVFHAEFEHEYVDSYTGDTIKRSGTIWVGENKYRVSNDQQTVVVDGETSHVYDESKNRVIISNYEPEEDDFAPSRFLNGTDSTYSVEQQKKSPDTINIELYSEDPFAVFKDVEIILNRNLVPLQIFARDQADNRITTTFSSGSFIPQKKDLFVLEYPEDAEIIDMRK